MNDSIVYEKEEKKNKEKNRKESWKWDLPQVEAVSTVLGEYDFKLALSTFRLLSDWDKLEFVFPENREGRKNKAADLKKS